MLKLVSKPKAIWSAFAIQKITFNKKKVPNVLNIFNIIEIRTIIIEKPKIFNNN